MSFLTLEFWGPQQRSGKTSLFPGGGPFQPCNPHELCRTLENEETTCLSDNMSSDKTSDPAGIPHRQENHSDCFCMSCSKLLVCSCKFQTPKIYKIFEIQQPRDSCCTFHLSISHTNFGNSYGAFWQIFQAQYLDICWVSKPNGPASAFTRMVVACSWASQTHNHIARHSQPAQLKLRALPGEPRVG